MKYFSIISSIITISDCLLFWVGLNSFLIILILCIFVLLELKLPSHLINDMKVDQKYIYNGIQLEQKWLLRLQISHLLAFIFNFGLHFIQGRENFLFMLLFKELLLNSFLQLHVDLFSQLFTNPCPRPKHCVFRYFYPTFRRL